MAFLDFIQRLLGLQKPSAETAKERLQLVLAHDRSDLNPELLEQMRKEILEVVQKYVEIDLEEGEVSLTTEDRVTALVANLPIRRARLKPLPLAEHPSSEEEPTHEPLNPTEPLDSAEAPPTSEEIPASEAAQESQPSGDGVWEH
ncbi:MAG: cell division topological specificity factor MinE [Cyanobacteriota bacterium]|jgi:cell division topological specificity factor|nr:cell division topological specificity factor MinE [Cyanobacteriota bacterium]